MSLIVWGEELMINIRQSDAQHKKLVGIINELHESMKLGSGQEQLQSILEALTTYTKVHFADEELLLEQHGYPVTNHKATHARFIEQLHHYQHEFKSGMLISLPVMKFLKEWLVGHIQTDDRKYSVYLHNLGVS